MCPGPIGIVFAVVSLAARTTNGDGRFVTATTLRLVT